jgi:hypothetical protein
MYMFLNKELLQNHKVETGYMRKQLAIIGMTLVLIIVGLSGCTGNNNGSSKSNEEKILGRWTGTIPGTTKIMTFHFYDNGSFFNSIDNQSAWGTYLVTNTTLKGISEDSVDYSFSDNDNKLTLIDSGGGIYNIILTRQ